MTTDQSTRSRMPAFYVPHGAGPCFFMDWKPADTWNNMAAFLKGIQGSLPATPRAIVLISGHWLMPNFSVTGHERPELIYDYYGFPPHTYELKYPAPGDPELAMKLVDLLDDKGMISSWHVDEVVKSYRDHLPPDALEEQRKRIIQQRMKERQPA